MHVLLVAVGLTLLDTAPCKLVKLVCMASPMVKDIPDDLWIAVRTLAMRRGCKVKDVVSAALRQYLAEQDAIPKPFPLREQR